MYTVHDRREHWFHSRMERCWRSHTRFESAWIANEVSSDISSVLHWINYNLYLVFVLMCIRFTWIILTVLSVYVWLNEKFGFGFVGWIFCGVQDNLCIEIKESDRFEQGLLNLGNFICDVMFSRLERLYSF